MGSRSNTGSTEPETKAAPRTRASAKKADTPAAKTGTKTAKAAGTRTAKSAAADPAAAAPKRPARAKSPRLSAEDRHRLISEAAYFHAERRGFHAGLEMEDWLKAEAEVDRLLAEKTPATH